MQTSRRGLNVDVEELDRVIDAAEDGPLSKSDCQKLKTTLHALVERLAPKRNTEKTNSVLEPKNSSSTEAESAEPKSAGHGRNAASAFTGAEKSPYSTRNLNRATLARNAAREEYTGRKSRRR
jgi:hypothetical protein